MQRGLFSAREKELHVSTSEWSSREGKWVWDTEVAGATSLRGGRSHGLSRTPEGAELTQEQDQSGLAGGTWST